ncbi:energy transducer TonB [Microbacter margulisiae]|uniref:energy transducer TonB n=1 Tax=Microbacter margulisiae TaxID=1350067 RepID=UPI003CCE3120
MKSKLIVQFTVDTTGQIKTPVIIKGVNLEINQKIINIVNHMPKWTPAYLYGKPIKQNYVLPFTDHLWLDN